MFSACGTSPVTPDVPLRLIGYGGYRASQPGLSIIRNSSDWQDLVAQSGLRAPSSRPEDPLPTVRFPDEIAVAVFLGGRPSSAYGIRVDRAVRERARMVIHATEEIGCVGLAIITYPLAAIAVARVDTPVEVVWSTSRLPC